MQKNSFFGVSTMINDRLFSSVYSRHRSKEQQAYIESPNGNLILSRKEITNFGDDGSIETTEIVQSQIVEGIKVTSHLQIAGQCSCGKFVPFVLKRYCYICGSLKCNLCVKFDSKLEKYLCTSCAKGIFWKRFRQGLWRLISSPFIERTAE